MDKDELGLSLNTNVNIETEPEYIEMDKLALSAPLEFLSKYNSPKEWILEQEEAERSRVWNGPAQVGPFEKAQYGVGQAIYEFERAPSEFLQVGAGLYKGLYDLFFPNSTETALDRFYNSLALSNLENRERREDLVKAYTGEDSDIVEWSSAIAQLGLIMASAGIGAGIGAQAAREGIEKLATETAKGVATRPAVIRRATQIAARKGAQTGAFGATIGTMFPQEAGSSALESVRQYIAQTGDTNLKNYKPGADSLTALAVGTINSAIEVGFGVERFIPEFWGMNTNFNRAARRFVEGTLGEGAEEFTQSLVSQIGEIVNGYRNDIDWNEAWHNALIGGVLGGAAGSGMYYLNRRRMARQVANDYNMPYKKAAALVDEMLGTGIESTTNELSARSELLNARGNAWDKMVTGVKTAMETVDFGDEQARNNQASQFAKTNVAIAIREAQKAGLGTDEFLDIAEFETVNNGQNLNMVFLKPLGSVQDIDKRIEAQDAIINRQKELKKTGADDKDAMRLAKQRKAILQKAKAIKQYNDAQYQEQIKANTTPETAQEIETATKDVETVKGATQAEFDSKVDTENLTSAEKSKRYGNAVLKSILPTKTSFDAVMVDPVYANAKQAIIAVADRINSFIKAHRTYSLKTDISNALQKMQTVNQGNFIDSVTTPDLDGVDVIAENAFLYHFLFSDATTIQTYLDSYITRAEDSLNQKKGKLSKKDLVGQSFKATDNAMQTQAQVIGAEYTSIYNEDGSYADKNVMAVMLSYQNQFVQEQRKIPTAEEQTQAWKKAEEITNRVLENISDEEKALSKKTGAVEIKGKNGTIYAPVKSKGDIFIKLTPQTDDITHTWVLKYQTYARNTEPSSMLGGYGGEFGLGSTGFGSSIYLDSKEEVETAIKQIVGIYGKDNIFFGEEFVDPAFSDYQKEYKRPKDIDWKNQEIRDIVNELWGRSPQMLEQQTSPLAILGYKWSGVLLTKDGETEYHAFRDEKAAREFVEEAKKHGYKEEDIQIVGFDEPQVLEQFDLANENARLDDIYPEYTGETIEVDGKERSVYNSEGKRIAKSKEALTNFWRWFGDSKAIDEEGQPLVLYHGTDEKFDTFAKSDVVGAFFFTDKRKVARRFTTKEDVYEFIPGTKIAIGVTNEGVMPVYLKMEDVAEYDGEMIGAGEGRDWRIAADKSSGRDGVIITDADTGAGTANEYIVFEPTQIKSVDNRGTYSADTGNIYYHGKKANGFYDPELGVIVLGRNMNEMTLPHEMQHYWLDKIFSIYKRAKSGELKVRDEWMTETKALFDMLGIDENQTQLTEGQQEKFARMSEAYLTGIGVSGDMNATFKEYQQWVPEKYKSMMNLAYKDDNGKIVLPYLDQAAVDFFNKWYANYSLPSLATSPERQEFINPEDENGEVLPVSIKEMNNRDKEFGNDAEEQVKTDERLYNTLDENMPAEMKVEADGQKVVQASRSNFLKESEKQQRRWFEHKSRDTEAQLAQDYIEKNPEHAKEVVYGDPELIPNDTGIDRATLINAYMALNNITPESEDWATLQTNIAINQSLAGTQLALSNNTSYRTYLDALREIENAREMKAATNYAGAKQGAVERFNRDIQRFVDEELPKVLATAPNTEARDIALKSLFERARTKFSGNTTGGVLNQMDIDFARSQKGMSVAFVRWAINQIKKDAGAKLNGKQQAQLLEESAKAQQAAIDIDSREIGASVAGAQGMRKWKVETDKIKGVSERKFSLFGDYAARAMLASFNTLVVSNIPSTGMNTLVIRGLDSFILGKNEVSKEITDSEIKRIKAIYGATAMNLAQMEKLSSPSLLHGEKYSASGQKWYDPFTILGKEDNWFRVPTFVDALARIATQDAKATGRNPNDVFLEYCRLSDQSDAAKLARKQAITVANMAVFTQDGALARALNGIRDWINQGSRALVGLDPKGFGLGNLLSPFLKTGANIAEMGIRGSLAPITTISALVQKWRSGKAIDPMKKLALAMDWTYFLLSSVMVSLLAALTSDDDEFYTEPYEMGKTYDPNKPYDSINIAGVWIDLDFFGPFAIPIRTGCRLVKQWKTDNLSAIYKGYGQGLKYAAMDTPLLQEIFNNQMSYASKKPEDWATGLAYNQANKLIPAQIKPLSRAISRGTGAQFDTGLGKVIERKFHRNYGFDGAELTTQDLIDIFSTRFTYQP